MFIGRQNLMNGNRRQKGVSLLTIALLLLLLGGALIAGVAYFRAQIPSDVASGQKEALHWADQSIIGFASIHHRLPCPAATPTGDENCTLAKGWLPAKALNLDTTMYEPGVLPMRYMVYRNATTVVDSIAYTHRDLAANEMVPSLPLPLPYNAYAPVHWDETADNDHTDIEDKGTHHGRYSGREDIDARNGLDMCETMRLAYSSVLDGVDTAYAHYLRGGAVINVAYGVAVPGLGDASGNNNRFDGANAGETAQMEPPDREHSYNYDDYVFVRDLPSLMTAMGCQPAHYDMMEEYDALIASGSFENLDDYRNDIGSETDTEIVDITMPDQLDVSYTRRGIAAATVSSVNTVAMMADAAAEVEALRNLVVENAESAVSAATQQAVLTGIGIATAVVGLVSNTVALAKAIAAIVASLGLHVGAWVASVAYAAGIVLSGVAVGLSIGAMVALIAAAVHAGNVVAALGGDTSGISDFCDTAGSAVDKDEMLENLNGQRDELVEKRDEAKDKRDAAKIEYDALTGAINDCHGGLLNNTPTVMLNGSNPPVICTETTYDDRFYCFDSIANGNRSIRIRYAPFLNLTLYQAKETAQQTYDEAIKRQDDLNDRITELQDTSSIDDIVNQYEQALTASGAENIDAKVAAYRQRLLDRNAEDLAKAIAEWNTLDAQIPSLLAAANNARQAVEDAENALNNASTDDDQTNCTAPESGAGTVFCEEMYGMHCVFRGRDLRYWITTLRYVVSLVNGNWFECFFQGGNYCQEPYYYSVWLEWQRAEEAYQMAVDNLEELDKNIADVENMDFSSCASGSDTVLLWGVDRAKEVLRRVDKRAVLQ